MTSADDTKGRACASIETSASSQYAFAALVEPARLARWFGTLSGPLGQSGGARLAFGDGDFFDLENVQIDPPERLRYSWRFLGIGPSNLITWTVRARPSGGAVVTVTDDYAPRTAQDVAEMNEGWTDFTGRLDAYLATGQISRYDWRRDLDGSVELCGSADAVAARLFGSDALRAWQPWQPASLSPGSAVRIDDGQTPVELELAEVDRSQRNEIRLVLHARPWLKPTRCTLAIRQRPGGAMLSVSHVGWEGIASSDAEQRRQRARFCNRWIESMKRARALVAQP